MLTFNLTYYYIEQYFDTNKCLQEKKNRLRLPLESKTELNKKK